jgi:hypothetical protein
VVEGFPDVLRQLAAGEWLVDEMGAFREATSTWDPGD